MGDESRTDREGQCACPFCLLYDEYKSSEAASHIRAIQRETLQLARCVLHAGIEKARDWLSSTRTR